MKKGFVFIFLIAVLVSTYYGLKNHFGVIEKITPRLQEETSLQTRLGTVHPILEDQMVVAVVLAENHAEDIQRCLDSLFNQTYPHTRFILIDNGSTDGTYERGEAYAKNREKPLELIRYETRRPRLEVLYEVLGHLDPHDVVTLIEGKDWLSHENVFDHLNCAYANPEVWMTHSRAIFHPNYQKIVGKPFSDTMLMHQKLRESPGETLFPLVTFYAGFFQAVKLQDLLYQGEFIDDCYALAVTLPLIEMGPEHVLFMNEVSYVINASHSVVDHQMHLQKVAAVESHLRSLPNLSPLSQLKLSGVSPSFHRYKADVILFSTDRPLHLYACLESLFSKGRDINDVYVLYQGSDQEFQRAYLNLQNEFHTVQFLNVCDYPGNDYATLLTKVLESRLHASPYVVMSEDHMILEEPIRFHDCIAALEKVHADHFFLFHEVEEKKALPHAIPISQGIYAYQLGEDGAHRPFSATLCRKSLFDSLEGIDTLPAFFKLWERKLAPAAVALFYEEKRVLPLAFPLDASLSQKKEWGHKFIEGYKIDLPSLTCELEEVEKGEIPLIKRDRRHVTHSTD
ncbi:MAG: glycosyltransferase [Chlamydiia bacterium]|nr:glycosyltransferase [Chlamydiia bacterium]